MLYTMVRDGRATWATSLLHSRAVPRCCTAVRSAQRNAAWYSRAEPCTGCRSPAPRSTAQYSAAQSRTCKSAPTAAATSTFTSTSRPAAVFSHTHRMHIHRNLRAHSHSHCNVRMAIDFACHVILLLHVVGTSPASSIALQLLHRSSLLQSLSSHRWCLSSHLPANQPQRLVRHPDPKLLV